MPWWGWLIIVIAAAIAVPIKLRILKNMMAKRNQQNEENTEDF